MVAPSKLFLYRKFNSFFAQLRLVTHRQKLER